MMHSDSLNWSIALSLSVLLYSAVFLQRGAQMGIESSTVMQSPLITRLSFNQIAEAVPDALPVIKKSKPERIKETAVVESTKTIEEMEITEPEKRASSPAQAQGQQVNHSAERLLQQKREQYLHQLLSHIESFKFYPRAARKRSIEGSVKISFTLLDNGGYEQLKLDGQRSVLVNATRSALDAAVPFPIPGDELKVSRIIEFAMSYSLTR